MAERLKSLSLNSVIIAVDTWLGAWDHWLQPEWFGDLKFEAGYPTLFRTFAANIIEKNLVDFVVPLPVDSLNASHILRARDIIPDVVHIDGGHDFEAVSADLRVWWPILKKGGVLIGDDYHPTGDTWVSVREAFHTFFNTTRLENFGGKCWIRKS